MSKKTVCPYCVENEDYQPYCAKTFLHQRYLLSQPINRIIATVRWNIIRPILRRLYNHE